MCRTGRIGQQNFFFVLWDPFGGDLAKKIWGRCKKSDWKRNSQIIIVALLTIQCVRVCAYVYVCVCVICLCTYVCVDMLMCVCVSVCVWGGVSTCVEVCVCVRVRKWARMCVCVW